MRPMKHGWLRLSNFALRAVDACLPGCGGWAWFRRRNMTEALSYRCPFCDREVRVGQPCPGCAQKRKPASKPARKSWQSDPAADGLDLPDEEFDYEDFVAREFGRAPHRALGVKWYWWLLGIAVLAAMVAGVVRG
jgi:hypothetical protein